MAGLLATRSLSDHFERVTVVERDVLPDGAELRKGVPQAAHVHGLLASGYRVLDAFFPDMMDDLVARGVPRGDVADDFLWFQYGHWKLRHVCGLRGLTVSRPLLEAAVRRRVKALPGVTFREGTEGVRPAFEAGRVTGLEVRDRETDATETLDADLVVDAGGRGSRSPKWLEEMGYEPPEEVSVRVDVGYATRVFERREEDLYGARGGIIAGTPPESTRYGAVMAVEGPRWMVTLVGNMRDYPPTDEAEWVDFAASLPVPAVHDLVTSAPPLSDIVAYRFPANRRRRYEEMERFPAGYLVLGDAICSFNPVYGQGMSVSALEAEALGECLAAGPDDLAGRFFARAGEIVDTPWTIATGEDLRYPQVEGERPPGFRIVNRYLERVHAVASDDPVVCRRFFDVLNLLAPPTSLMKPAVAWRVLARRAPKGPGSPRRRVTPARP